MTDKMTDNEIITALEHCSASMDCDSCNFGISENCVGNLLKVSLDLIIRLKEANKHHEKAESFAEKAFKLHEEETKLKDKEIEILIRKKEALKDEISEKDAEIDRLKESNKRLSGQIMRLKHEIERVYAEGLQLNKIFLDFVTKCEHKAYREFAESLKDIMFNEDFLLCEPCDMANIIDNLVAEMMEGRENE